MTIPQPQKDYSKLFEERYNAALRGMKFPEDKLHMFFQLWLTRALPHHNMFTLQTDWETLKAIRNKRPSEFDMLEFCNALNAVEMSLPIHYQNDSFAGINYDEIQEATKAMTATWNEITTPIRETIQAELQAEYDKEQKSLAAKQALSGGTNPKRRAIA